MGWWPFGKKRVKDTLTIGRLAEPHLRTTREWLEELQMWCESNLEAPRSGGEGLVVLTESWEKAHSDGEMEQSLLEGLTRRCNRFLRCSRKDRAELLENEDYWRPGQESRS